MDYHPPHPQANHFDPYSPIFSKRERIEVFLSDIGLLGMLATLGYLGNTMGWLWVVRVYLIPYLIVNHWLVTITFLQHTHPALPHYDSSEWDWLRGALSTVDRSYGILVCGGWGDGVGSTCVVACKSVCGIVYGQFHHVSHSHPHRILCFITLLIPMCATICFPRSPTTTHKRCVACASRLFFHCCTYNTSPCFPPTIPLYV